MQLSYPLEDYRICVERAFCELLINAGLTQYASNIPNMDRFKKFLTRLKEKDPSLKLPELCATGLPANWAYIQWNRGPLTIVDEDEFRKMIIRENDETLTTYDETQWGYGHVELNYWLVANNGSAIEAAEALFYMRLYKLKSIFYEYQCINWKSRVIHSDLQSFDALEMEDMGTGFTITWTTELFVPILRGEKEGGINLQESITNIFDRSEIMFTDERCDEKVTKYVSPTSDQWADENIDKTGGVVPLDDGQDIDCNRNLGQGSSTGSLDPGSSSSDRACIAQPGRTASRFDDPPTGGILEQIASDGAGSTWTENDPPIESEEEP